MTYAPVQKTVHSQSSSPTPVGFSEKIHRLKDPRVSQPECSMPLWNDARFALRQLRKSPAFTLVVLATLGLCIGANTAIYSVLDAVLLRPAPYPELDRLALVDTHWRQNGKEGEEESQTGARFEGVRDGSRALDVAAFGGDSGVNFAAQGHLEYVRQQRVSAGFFRVLGIAPQMGREFSRAEDTAGGPAVAVLSYEFWRRVFGEDTSALGRAIDLRGEPYTVVGIMPRGFRAGHPADVWTPLRPSRTGEGSGQNYGVIAGVKPGFSWAAVALTLPYERPLNDGFRILDGDDGSMHGTEAVYVTPGYFATMRIPVLRGREFLDSDTPASAPVVVVSQSFAARFFHGKEAVGHHLSTGEIVGVVGDVQQHTGLYQNHGPISVEPTLYFPVSQTSDGMLQLVHAWFSPKWVIRASGPIGSLTAQVQRAVASVDSQLPIASFQTIDDLQVQITSGQRYRAALFSIFAGLALLLAAAGIYGSISQSIAQRTHELGVRMALGASAAQTIAGVMKPGILLALLGAGAGYLLSLAATRFLEHLLWGVRPADPIAFAAAAAILLLTAALASLAPALRILRLDPAQTLRNE